MKKTKPFVAIHVVPTGVGANIGGFAGDAGPANRLLASCVDFLICNPNVVNSACMINLPDNVLYTEGYSLDSFCKGLVSLRIPENNKIGVVFDKAISENVLNITLNAVNAVVSAYGINIVGYVITEEPVGIEYFMTENNISSGTINNPKTLLVACNKMLNKGADALAVVCNFPDLKSVDNYSEGQGVDPIGGVEAIISHLVSYEFKVPCAHAPAFSYEECLPYEKIVDPRAASEYFATTFLPCVLQGLVQAPQIVDLKYKKPYDLTIEDVQVLVLPFDCLGNAPVLSAMNKNIKIIAVKENTTELDITAEKLGLEDKIIVAENYLEACGYLKAFREGLSPKSILRPLQKTIGI